MAPHQHTHFIPTDADDYLPPQLPSHQIKTQEQEDIEGQETDDCSLSKNLTNTPNTEESDYQYDNATLHRMCSACGKSFSSGKALGGHKRACIRKKIDKVDLNKPVSHNLDPNENSNSCYVCGRFFTSLKSLYGHMRKHPEREWRGVRPYLVATSGTAINQSSSSTISDDTDYDSHEDMDDRVSVVTVGTRAVDLTESLTDGWKVKDRRGRKLLSGDNSATKEDDQDMQQAARELLMLSQLSPTVDNNTVDTALKKRKLNHCEGSGYEVLKITETKLHDATGHDDDGKKSNNNDKAKGKVDDDGHEDDSEMRSSLKKTKKLIKKRKLNELEDHNTSSNDVSSANITAAATMSQKMFHCPICNKGFDKHQALGGHVASHNKNNVKEKEKEKEKESCASAEVGNSNNSNNNNNNLMMVTSEKGGQVVAASDDNICTDESSGRANNNNNNISSGNEHQCSVCGKSFATGQALGGHMRCHWNGPPEGFSSTSQVTVSAGGEVNDDQSVTVTAAANVAFDVDLNDTPPDFHLFFE